MQGQYDKHIIWWRVHHGDRRRKRRRWFPRWWRWLFWDDICGQRRPKNVTTAQYFVFVFPNYSNIVYLHPRWWFAMININIIFLWIFWRKTEKRKKKNQFCGEYVGPLISESNQMNGWLQKLTNGTSSWILINLLIKFTELLFDIYELMYLSE